MKDYEVLVIPHDAEIYATVWELPKAGFTDALKERIEMITGFPYEHVSVYADFSGGTKYTKLDMFVNEEGHLIGLPVNLAATAIYHNATRIFRPEEDRTDLPLIVGNAVLFRERVWL